MLAAETEAAETQNGPRHNRRGPLSAGDLDGRGGLLRCAAHQVGEITAQDGVYHNGRTQTIQYAGRCGTRAWNGPRLCVEGEDRCSYPWLGGE